jgi:N-acyl-D-amino-acid deacylase
VIRGGTVVDGTGAAPQRKDVLVRGDRIVELLNPGDSVADVDRLDATGCVVTPGFIDTHVHSDYAPYLAAEDLPLRLASVVQGVTTEVSGNCGFSAFPVPPAAADAVAARVSGILGRHGHPSPSLAAYGADVEARGLVCNLAPLVGHNTLLTAALTEHSWETAQHAAIAAAERSLGQGAVGASTGLIYVPGNAVDTGGLEQLAELTAHHGVPYCTHIRNEAAGLAAAVEEAVTIARHTGASVHISHLKVAGRPNWPTLEPVLEAIAAARASGLDISADAYPYTAGSTALSAMFPPWLEADGTERMLDRLRQPAVRAQIVEQIATGVPGWPNPVGDDGWANVVVAGAPDTREAEGRTVAELGDGDDRGAVDAACELLLANGGAVTVIIHAMSDDNVDAVLAQPYVMLGSDGIPLPGRPHPRVAGTFSRWLGHYVRERGLLGLAEAVHRITGLPAQRFRLTDRGRVAAGYRADLAIFLDTVHDRASYDAPLRPPAGVRHVLVAGQQVIRDGGFTGAYPGRVLAPS